MCVDLDSAVKTLRRACARAEGGDETAVRSVLAAAAAVDVAETMLTVTEVAQRMRVDRKTVRRAIAAGRLHAVRAGRSVRVPVSSLAQWRTS